MKNALIGKHKTSLVNLFYLPTVLYVAIKQSSLSTMLLLNIVNFISANKNCLFSTKIFLLLCICCCIERRAKLLLYYSFRFYEITSREVIICHSYDSVRFSATADCSETDEVCSWSN